MPSKKKHVVVSKERGRSFRNISGLLIVIVVLAFILDSCSQSENPQKTTGKEKETAKSNEPTLYETSRINCSIFTKNDAAGILDMPAAEVQIDSQELYEGNWQCLYKGGSFEKMVSFNITISQSVEEAVNDMDQYRSHLDIAGKTKPFKDDLEGEAYSNISGIGDEALWTAANETLTMRKGNVSLQIQQPKNKNMQIKIAKEFLLRLDSEK